MILYLKYFSLGIVVHTYTPRELRQEAQDVKASMDDIESSRPAYVIERPCLKNQKAKRNPLIW